MATSPTAHYRHQDVSRVPRGWRVATVKVGEAHQVRIAFPPGRRRKGSGKLVSILHPKGENPSCDITPDTAVGIAETHARTRNNPEELVVLGLSGLLGNPRRGGGRKRLREIEAELYVIGGKLAGPWKLEPAEKTRLEARDKELRAELRPLLSGGGNPRTPSWPTRLDDAVIEAQKALYGPLPTHEVRLLARAAVKAAKEARRAAYQALKEEEGGKKKRKRNPSLWILAIDPGQTVNFDSKAEALAAFRAPHSYISEDAGTYSVDLYAPDAERPMRSASYERKKQLGRLVRARRRNPSPLERAKDLFRSFHGKDPSKIIEKQISTVMRKDYTALGPLVALGLSASGGKPATLENWEKTPHLKFGEDVMLASAPDGNQLYLIGGNQNIDECLPQFPGVDVSKDFIDLGELSFVVYFARKAPSFEPTEWFHEFGEEGGTRPRAYYDRLRKLITIFGGTYHVEQPGIVN